MTEIRQRTIDDAQHMTYDARHTTNDARRRQMMHDERQLMLNAQRPKTIGACKLSDLGNLKILSM